MIHNNSGPPSGGPHFKTLRVETVTAMTIKMKALRSFGTKKANEGHVKRGREFEALDEPRARDLEARGFAYRVETKSEPKHKNKMAPAPVNKAAQSGPLSSAGGETGAETAPSSSEQVRQPRPRRSRTSKAELDL